MTNEIFLKNIDTLRQNTTVKISDFEKEVGVSAGYFSRLSKSPESLPGTDLLLKLSAMFGMSIDILLLFEIGGMGGDEKKLLSFFQRLRNETAHGMRFWKQKESRNMCYLLHTLLPADNHFGRPEGVRYNGLPLESEIAIDCVVELVPTVSMDEDNNIGYSGLEVNFIENGKTIPVCASYRVHPALRSKMFELGYVAGAVVGNTRIQIEANTIIDKYLGE